MIRYCDIHGPIEVPPGPPNQVFKCTQPYGGVQCNTALSLEPGERWKALSSVFDNATTTHAPALVAQDRTPQTRARDSQTDLRQGAFLAAYAKCANVSKAAAAAEIGRRTHYDWMDSDPDYSRAFYEAHRLAMHHLVDVAVDRATGATGEASDRLMVKLLESMPAQMTPAGWNFNPSRKLEHSGPDGGPIMTETSAIDALESRIAELAAGTDPASGS